MKKLLLLPFMLVLLSIYDMSAQAYVPFPTSNASWIELEFCQENHYEITGDTTVNGKIYHKLSVRVKFFNQTANGTCQLNSVGLITQPSYVGAFRNDSVNKLVYYLPMNQSLDTLLHNFNYTLGDTLKNTYKFFDPFYFNGPLTVSSIDSVQLASRTHKRINFSGSCNSVFRDTLRLIEGIGSNHSLLGDYILCNPFINASRLYCYKNQGQIIYFDSVGTCNLISSLDNKVLIKAAISFYPNPTKGIVNIPYVAGFQKVEVYNIAGKLLQNFVDFDSPPNEVGQAAQSDKSNERINKINLSNYEAGIYFLKLIMKNGEVFAKKVVKQ